MIHAKAKLCRFMKRSFGIHIYELRYGYLSGIVMLSVFVVTRIMAGSPYSIYLLLRGTGYFPPLGIYAFLNILFTVGIGFAFGIVWSKRRGCVCTRAEKYRVGMFFILLSVFWFAVYPLMFRGNMLLLTLLCLLVVWAFSLICMVMLARIQYVSGIILFAFLMWVSYLILMFLKCILL